MTPTNNLPREVVVQLEDIVRLCKHAEALANRGREWFDSDPDLIVPRLAGDSIVLKKGEAVNQLPQGFLDARRGDPTWRRAMAMWHRITRECDAVDYEIVWQVLSLHARALRLTVEALLSDST